MNQELREYGYCILRNCLPKEKLRELQMHMVDLECHILALPELPIGVELSTNRTTSPRVSKIEPTRPYSKFLSDLMSSKTLGSIAKEVLGEPCFLLEDKLICKPPGCEREFPPHQELHWTRPLSEVSVCLVIPLQPCTTANGPLFVVPGSHRSGYIPHVDDLIPDSCFDRNAAIPLLLEVGDVAAFVAGTIHFSGANLGHTPRTLLLLSYNSSSEGNVYEEHLKRWQSSC